MIDIGVNLLSTQFDPDRSAVIDRARAAGIEHMIITGTDLHTSRDAVECVAAADAGLVSCTAGVHPHHAGETGRGWLEQLKALAQRPEVVAVGETGLDFNRNFSPRDAQERVFRQQLDVAASLGKPVFVHDREAGATVAACLDGSPALSAGVVVHCFTGAAGDLERYLDLGCLIGITGWVCDRRRGAGLRELVPRIPLDRLMIETDAPFLKPHNAPRDAHGRRNEPALLVWVVRQLAELYGTSPHELTNATSANARRFFGLPEPPRG